MKTAESLQLISEPMEYRTNPGMNIAEALTEDQKQETLDFLALRPVNTAVLAGGIYDHGIVSERHRGIFYGFRNSMGILDGVALIGRNTIIDARTDEAIKAFGECARGRTDIKMVFAEADKLETFWKFYRGADQIPEITYHHLINSTGCDAGNISPVAALRIAKMDDLEHIVLAHAEMVLAETGNDPLKSDPVGFRMRCAERVEKGRVWVWIDDGRLVFKTDVVSVTPKAIYVEGLWVNPKDRGKGYSSRCLVSMCEDIFKETETVCGFLDDEHTLVNSLYRKAGFRAADRYAKIFV